MTFVARIVRRQRAPDVEVTVSVSAEIVDGPVSVEQWEEWIRDALEEYHRNRGGHVGRYTADSRVKRPRVTHKG